MADKLYWGVLFTESLGAAYIGMAQIDFLDASNNSLCVGGVALSKHTHSGYYPANLFNGNWSQSDAWYNVNGMFPCRVYYQHQTPVEPFKLKIKWGNSSNYLPKSVDHIFMCSTDNDSSWLNFYKVSIESGSIDTGQTTIFTIGAEESLSFFTLANNAIDVKPHDNGLDAYTSISSTLANYSQGKLSNAKITDRAIYKTAPGSPELPMVFARIWLLRYEDGFKAWEGFTDANGYYHADGLEEGVAYIAVGIDGTRTYKVVGTGPVVASL